LASYYGVLAGPAFAASYSICGIFAGVISDRVNRKIFIGICCILWSICTLLSGFIDSFAGLFIFRFMLGMFESAFNPCAYGIISDNFHPSSRTIANSLYNSAIYLGGALSSLAGIMITSLGWRGTFEIIGLIGIGSGIIGLIFIMEPKRGKFDVKKVETNATPVKDLRTPVQKFLSAGSEIFVNPTCRYTAIAGSCRFFAGYGIGFFMPAYFGHNYKDQ